MSPWALAQLNVAQLRAPLDSPALEDFVAGLDPVNALAEASPGFLWRLQTDAGDATALRPFGDDVIVNLSLWQDLAALQAFVFRSEHAEYMRQRRQWFLRMKTPQLVLWWVPAGHEPGLEEARDALQRLQETGASPQAFDFRTPFPTPGAES